MSAASEFLRTHTRVRQDGSGWRFEVADCDWPEVYRSVEVWRLFRSWRTPPDAERITRAGQAVLADKRFVCRCGRCGELNVPGNMHNRITCHDCAAKFLGILY